MFNYYNFNNWLYYHYKRNGKILEQIKQLNKSQWNSSEYIKEYQEKKFRDILSYAYKCSNYYREIFDSIGLKDSRDFSLIYKDKLPILTKSKINENLEAITCNKEGLILNQTGGSTGIPLKFYNNKEFLEIHKPAANIRAYNMGGYRLGDDFAVIWGYDNDIPVYNFKRRVINSLVHKNIELNSFDLDKRKMTDFCNKLITKNSFYIKGYASSLFELAVFINENKIDFNNKVKAIYSEAEKLTERKRTIIEKSFCAKVFNYYGSREFGTIANECDAHNGLHINYEQLYLERTIEGKILITSFFNLGTPFIRYEIGDNATKIIDDNCSCGRCSSRIEEIEGRESDNFITKSGKVVHGEYITHLFYSTKAIKQFQVIQNDFSSFQINIVAYDEKHAREEIEILKREIENHFEDTIDFEIEYLYKIPKTKTGKLRFTTRNF